MADSSIFWLRVAACFYAVGLIHSMLVVLHRKHTLYPLALEAFKIGAVLHTVAIVELGIAYGHFPVDNFYESLCFCALLIAAIYLLAEWRYKFPGTAVVIFPLVSIATLVAAMERPVGTWSDVRVRDAWLVVHIVLVLAGYAALLLAAVASVFYLVQERRLKSKRAILPDKLPPLATIDNLISASMGFSFVFMTVGVVFGITWAFVESGTRWLGESKVALSFFTWALCLIMIFLRVSAGWRGRKAAWMALVVLGSGAITWAAHVGLRPVLAP